MSIIDELNRHNNKEKVSFHMPGHKYGKGLKGTFLESDIWRYDTTELSDTDCLQNPSEFIKSAEEKAAKIYGAEKSFFLVNGSTCGILSMFYASFKEGDKVIITRGCHKSVINAMIVTGIKPIYIEPKRNEYELFVGADIEEVEKTFQSNRDCKGIFVTSPSYFGIMSDIKKISDIAHKYNALVICDEAHGAHFPFSNKFPETAMNLGADLSVVSLHKTLYSPNQTAVLNLGKCRVSEKQVRSAVNMFQTTSPSYVFLSSMDEALNIAFEKGNELTEKLLSVYPKDENIITFDDPFKVVLNFSNKGFDGKFVAELLENNYGIFCEMVQEDNVLLILSWANTEEDFFLLKEAIKYIKTLPNEDLVIQKEKLKLEYKMESEYTPRKAYIMEKEHIKFYEAIGRIAAEEVTSFPPCIPYFMPGERITENHIKLIEKALEKGNVITGLENDCICVVKE